jgi:hypothetical protein
LLHHLQTNTRSGMYHHSFHYLIAPGNLSAWPLSSAKSQRILTWILPKDFVTDCKQDKHAILSRYYSFGASVRLVHPRTWFKPPVAHCFISNRYRAVTPRVLIYVDCLLIIRADLKLWNYLNISKLSVSPRADTYITFVLLWQILSLISLLSLQY